MGGSGSFDVGRELRRIDVVRGAQRRWQTRERADVLDPDRVHGMVAVEHDLIRRGRWVAGPATLFGVLGLQHREVESCRVLGWLFDPLAPHGLGTAMLHRLVDLLEADGADPIDRGSLSRTTVDLEVTRPRSRADLVLTTPSGTVVIEAKVFAGEQPRQGERLESDWPEATYVFLTRRGQPMETAGPTSRWHQLTWTALLRTATDLLHDPPTSAATPAVSTARAAVADFLIATGHKEHRCPTTS